jgi:hypothetical protein
MLIMTDRCVFCGNPIGPDEARTGRESSAAHAACADRALGDVEHWDEIARAAGIDDEPAGEPSRRSRGCLMVVAVVLIAALVLAAAVGFAPF